MMLISQENNQNRKAPGEITWSRGDSREKRDCWQVCKCTTNNILTPAQLARHLMRIQQLKTVKMYCQK